MKTESSKLEAYGFPLGRVWAVALSCSLVCAQSGIVPDQAFADPAETQTSALLVTNDSASYTKGDKLTVNDTDIAYYVYDAENHKAAIGNGKRIWATTEMPAWPETVTIPKTVTDANGVEWTVSRIENFAFQATQYNHVSKFIINADLDYVGQQAFAGFARFTQLLWPVASIEWNGTVKEIDSRAFQNVIADTITFPEGSLVSDTLKATGGTGVTDEVYPFSSYNDISERYKGANLFLKNPFVVFDTAVTANPANNVYFWADSDTQSNFATATVSLGAGRAMAVLSSDGYTFSAPKSATESGNFTAAKNVDISVKDGDHFVGSPSFTLTCKGNSDGSYGWEMAEGTDYVAKYFDASGNELDKKPITPGNYFVQFVGNEKASWGSSEKISFVIDTSIAGAVVTSDDDGKAYSYDAETHAPSIKVTLNGAELPQGDSYKIVYVGEDSSVSEDAPKAAGSYTAMVVSKQPSTGGLLGEVKFSISARQLQGGALSAGNVEVKADGSAVAPSITVTDADGNVVPAAAYTVSYTDKEGKAVAADDLKSVGTYTAKVTGDNIGCFGELEQSFSVVETGKSIAKAEQNGSLTYTGEALAAQFTVTDANNGSVSADNYTVAYTDKDGNAVAAGDLKNAGTYTATLTAAGTQYAGSATCQVVVAAKAVEAADVNVELNRTVFDYQSTPEWDQSAYDVDETTVIGRKSKAIDVAATVKLDDKELTEGVDYVVEKSGEIVSSLEDTKSHEATVTVQLQGNYSGSVEQKITINKRTEHVVEYKGVKFSYAVNNDGETAVITGLGVDLTADSTQGDIAKAYSSTFDINEGVFIPGSIEVDGKTLQVVGISDYAFSVPGYAANNGSQKRDVWNGAKKLTIEKGIKEIGYSSCGLGLIYCDVEELSLPEGLEVIHVGAFGNSKVKKIEIPASVTSIGYSAFGEHNGTGNPYLEEFTFAKGSKFTDNSEGYWQSSGTSHMVQTWNAGTYQSPREILGGYTDALSVDGSREPTPMKEIKIPAGYTSANILLASQTDCTDFYFMGDSYPDTSRSISINERDASDGISEWRIWGWDVEGNGLANVKKNAYEGANLVFRPFSVLGNSASDTYTYTEAWNAETQATDGTKDYAANTFVGEPEVTNQGGEVMVDWNLSTEFVNKDYAWTPEEGTDYTVKYQKVGSDTQVDKITEAGTYTAMLTGNGKTCFGSVTSTVQVDAVSVEDATVTVDDSSLVYTGAGQTPDVTVVIGEDDNAVTLEKGTDYTVEYVNAVDATDSESKATVRVTGCGLYEGTVDQTFEIAQAPLTVTVANAEKTFGDDDPTFGISSTEGLVGGDSVVTASFTRVKGESAGAYAIACTDIVVKDKSNKRLVTDNYKVTYKDGSLTIIGEAAVDISSADVSAIADQTFYGSAVRPAVTVKVGGKELAEGTDYTVSYANNDKVGKATATVTGIGSYAGAKTVEFNVVKLVQFPDVRSSDWFNDSVVSAVRAGYMNGYADGTFGPNDTLTRGQAACVLANMAGADGAVAYTGQFADVEGSEYYAANVAWAKRTGVMSGYAGTSNFGPVDNLTREQMACTLYNFAKYIDGKDVSVADVSATLAKYSDGNGVDSWAAEAVAWAVENGIMGNGGFINATGEITRAEMAAMAVNYMSNLH